MTGSAIERIIRHAESSLKKGVPKAQNIPWGNRFPFRIAPPIPNRKAMCKKWQPYSSRILPPSSGRRCPEGAEVGFRCGIEKQCEIRLSRFVIPSAAEGSFSSPVSVFLRKAVCMRRRTPKSHEARGFPFSALLTASPDRERKRFLAFARNDDTGNGTLPPSSGRRCPEGAEVGYASQCLSRIASPITNPKELAPASSFLVDSHRRSY